MAGITKEQRYQSWNVQLFVGSRRISGFYQRGDLLRIKDVAHELELCLTFDMPDGEVPWQPALLAHRDTTGTSQSLIILDHQNELPFPTPMNDEIKDYYYVFHHPSQCAHRDLHSLRGIESE